MLNPNNIVGIVNSLKYKNGMSSTGENGDIQLGLTNTSLFLENNVIAEGPITGISTLFISGTTNLQGATTALSTLNVSGITTINNVLNAQEVRQQYSVSPLAFALLVPIGSVISYAGSTPPNGWLLCNGTVYNITTNPIYTALYNVIGNIYDTGLTNPQFRVPDLRSRIPIGAGQGAQTETFSFNAIDINSGTITVNSNTTKWITGMAVTLTTSGTIPENLINGATYYIIRVNSTTIKLANSLSNAVAEINVNITSQGLGNHTITTTYTNKTLAETGGKETHTLTIGEIPSHSHSYVNNQNDQGTDNAFGTETAADNVDMNQTTGTTGGNLAHSIMNPYLVLNFIIKY